MRFPKRLRPIHPKLTYRGWGVVSALRLLDDFSNIRELPGVAYIRQFMPEIDGAVFWAGSLSLLCGFLLADAYNPESWLRNLFREKTALFVLDIWTPISRTHDAIYLMSRVTMLKSVKHATLIMIVDRLVPDGKVVRELSHTLFSEKNLAVNYSEEFRLASVPLSVGNAIWTNSQNLLGGGQFVISFQMTAKLRIGYIHKIYLQMLQLNGGTCGRFVVFDESHHLFSGAMNG